MGLLGTLVGGITSLFGGFQQNANIDKQISAQQQAQQAAAQYNKELAKYQNDLNMEMWQKVANYNSPANQRKLLTEAGLNPDLMYGNGSSSFSAPNAPNMTSGAPVSPVDMSALGGKKTAGQIAREIAEMNLIQSQEKKTTAEAEGQKETNKILSADALIRNVQNEQAIEIGKSQIYLNHSIAEMNHNEAEKISAEVTKLGAEFDNLLAMGEQIRAQTSNIQESVLTQQFERYLKSREFELLAKETYAKVRNLESGTYKNYEDVRDLLTTRMARLMNIRTSNMVNIANERLSNKQIQNLEIENEYVKFNLDYDKSYRAVYQSLGAAGDITQAIGIGVASAIALKGGSFKKMKPIGFKK